MIERNRVFTVILFFSLIFCFLFSTNINAEELKIYTENSPSLSFKDKNGKITGSSVDLVQEIQKRINSKDTIEMYPWARAYSLICDPERTNIVLFPMTFTEKRSNLFKWVGPVAQNSWQLFAKAESPIKITNLDDAKKVKSIGTYRKDVRETFLIEKGFTNLVSTTNNVQNLHKLLSGRIVLWMTSDAGALQTSDNQHISYNRIKPVYTVRTNGLYIAFHKNTSDAIVKKWQQIYDEIKEDGTMEHILDKWDTAVPTYVK